MKKQITISHLVVNGCSFTYGDGLASPNTQAWPALLANKLGVPVVNLALGGASNDRNYRKTVEYLFADSVPNPFYIIGMTSSTRCEMYNTTELGYSALNIAHPTPDKSWNARLEKLLAEESDDIELGKRKLNLWLSIINLFKAIDINYLIIDTIPDDHKIISKLRVMHPKLCEYVLDDTYHISNYSRFVGPLSKLPCGHDDATSQVKIADYLYDNMIDRYDIIIEPSQEYLHIKDFYTEDEIIWASGRSRGDWII